MAWIDDHPVESRTAVYILLLLTLLAPWMYSRDGVPPPDWCNPPHLLTSEGECVALVRGGFIFLYIGYFFQSVFYSVSFGEFSFKVMYNFLPIFGLLLPFITTWIVIRRDKPHHKRYVHIAGCLLALLALISMIVRGVFVRDIHFWGMGLYFLTVLSLLVLELRHFRNGEMAKEN